MTKLKDIISLLELAAPRSLQESYDNSGLQVGFPDAEIGKVLVCLDVTEEIVAEAAEKGCSLIVSHHPLIFKALKTVSDATYQQRCVVKALTGGIAIYSAHTSLDNAPGGVNYKIASIIGLDNLSFLSPLEGREGGSGVQSVSASNASVTPGLSERPSRRWLFAAEPGLFLPLMPAMRGLTAS